MTEKEEESRFIYFLGVLVPPQKISVLALPHLVFLDSVLKVAKFPLLCPANM